MDLSLYLNRNGGVVTLDPNDRNHLPSLEIKRGTVNLRIYTARDQVPEALEGSTPQVKFVIKTRHKYEEDPSLASGLTTTAPATANDPWLLTVNADDAAVRTAMLVDGNPNNDPDDYSSMAVICTSPDGTAGSWTESLTIPVTLTNRVSQDDDTPPPGAVALNVRFLSQVSAYIGGTSDCLDSTPTLALGVPQMFLFVVGGLTREYELISSTHVTDGTGFTYVRPTDYAPGTNEKVFKDVGLVSGSGSGTLPWAVTDGGTGSTTAGGARTNLGVAIGSDVQAYNVNLASFAGLSLVADRLAYATGAGALALATITAFGRSLIDDVDNTAARVTLGAQASNANLNAISGLSFATADRLIYTLGSGGVALATLTSFARTLLDDVDAATMRGTLGLVPGTNVQTHNSNLDALAANTTGGPAVTLNNVSLVCLSFSGDGSALTSLNATNFATGTLPASRGGAGAVVGLLKGNGLGSPVTGAVPGVDYTAPGAGAGINGQTRTFTCPAIIPASTAVNNGDALRTAYTAAKALTPNGAAISSTNRARVVVPPGVYDLVTTPLGLDGEFVDLVGLTGHPADVLITSQVTASSSGTVAKTASDVHIYGVTLQNQAALGTPAYDDTDPSAFADLNSTGTLLENCVLLSGDNGAWCMQQSIDWAGTYRRCIFGDYALGANGGTFSGTATDCVSGINGFASTGTFSGVATNCTGGDASFAAGGGHFTGRAYYCLSGNTGFGGGGGTLTGKLYYCRISTGTFPTVSGGGKTRYCIDGTDTANNQG